MEFITCSLCGNRVQQSNGIDICGVCVKTKGDRVKILAIKRYLDINPKATVQDVLRDLNVRQSDIDRLVKEGSLRLIYSKDGMKVVDAKKEEKEFRNSSEEDRKKQVISELAQIYNPYVGKDRNVKGTKQMQSKLVYDLNKRFNNRQKGGESR